MPKLYMDIETRSAIDLKKSGVYVYAESPSTEIIVWAYALDDGKMQFYYPIFKQPFPKDLKESLLNPDTIFVAHNAGFERILLTLVGIRFIPVAAHKEIRKIERWSCTAARARSCALPGALDNVAHALQLPVKKDKEGYDLMMRMCKPNGLDMEGKAVFYGNDADILRLGEYCGVDTEVERLVDKRLPTLSPDQNAVWILTEKMNDRGINVDDNLLMRLMTLTEDAVLDLNTRIYKMTDGAVSKVTKVAELKAWLESQGIEDLDGVGKDVILSLIEDPDVRDDLKEVLCIRRDGGKSSTAKFSAIANRMNRDGRIRGNLIFSGASASGRWCVAEGTMVLCRTEGAVQEKPIENVSLSDEIWDGDNWVNHNGSVFSGVKEVIFHDGIWATPTHEVFVSDTLKMCLSEAKRLDLSLFSGNENAFNV